VPARPEISPVNFSPLMRVVVGYYAAITVVTFALYACDKQAARRAGARIRGRTLHFSAWLGGFFGALAGQHWLRHKSLRPAFALSTWSALLAHLAAWVWWLAKR